MVLLIEISIMKADKDNQQNYLKFYALASDKTILIPKSKVRTWHDLLIELENLIGIQANRIEIAVNNQKVYYDPSTKLADIAFRSLDRCFVLSKPTHQTLKAQQIYDKQVQKQKQKCMKALKIKDQHEDIVRMISFIGINSDYQELYNELAHEYGKVETMIAIQKYQGNRKDALVFLKSGKAAQQAENIHNKIEKEYLEEFMNKREIMQIKQFIRDNNLSEEAYRGIVLKLFEKYPTFKEYEPRHQKYVQQELYGKVLDTDQSELEELEEDRNPYKKIIQEIMSNLKPKEILQQQIQAFTAKMKAEVDDQTIEEALVQANYDLSKAEIIIREGLIPEVERYINTCDKTCRINIVVEFFNRPEFDKIKASLQGNPKKAEKFVNWVISQNKNNSLFTHLLKKFKDYAISFLSGQFCIEKPEKLQNKVVKHKPQLQAAKQVKLRGMIKKVCNPQLLQALVSAGVQPQLAEYAVRAAKNQPSQLQKYLQFGAKIQRIDFCPQGPEKQQLYLFKRFKKDRELIIRLRDKNEYLLWLSQISVLRPKLFQIVIKNKPFFDWMVTCMEV